MSQCSDFLKRGDLPKLETLFSFSPAYFPPLRPISYGGPRFSIHSPSSERRDSNNTITKAYAFPISNQTVIKLPWAYDVSSTVTTGNSTVTTITTRSVSINVTSSVAYLQSSVSASDAVSIFMSTDSFRTQCPHGFVVPGDLTHPRNHWIPGTG
jgi:hypothetical protein